RDTSRTQGGDNYKFSWAHSWENLIATLDYATHEGQVSSAAAVKDTSRNNVAYFGVPGITNADLQLGGFGQDTIDFRNKDTLSLTRQYCLETDCGYRDIKFGYARTENELKTNLVYSGDGAQYTSIGTQNSGVTLAQYTGGGWTGAKSISADDY